MELNDFLLNVGKNIFFWQDHVKVVFSSIYPAFHLQILSIHPYVLPSIIFSVLCLSFLHYVLPCLYFLGLYTSLISLSCSVLPPLCSSFLVSSLPSLLVLFPSCVFLVSFIPLSIPCILLSFFPFGPIFLPSLFRRHNISPFRSWWIIISYLKLEMNDWELLAALSCELCLISKILHDFTVKYPHLKKKKVKWNQ